jgi:hypothetical protein
MVKKKQPKLKKNNNDGTPTPQHMTQQQQNGTKEVG